MLKRNKNREIVYDLWSFFFALKLSEQKQWNSPKECWKSHLLLLPKFIRLFRSEGGNTSWSGTDKCGVYWEFGRVQRIFGTHGLPQRTTYISSLQWTLVSSAIKWGAKAPPCGSDQLVSLKCHRPSEGVQVHQCSHYQKELGILHGKMTCTHGRKMYWDIHLELFLIVFHPPPLPPRPRLILGK